MSAALKFKQGNLPRQAGELARLKIVQGPDYGSVYVIASNRVTIGRGDDNDVILADLKASRRHAELLFSPEGWLIRDTGSANGILYGGKFVRSVNLRSGEVVSIGETTLEFVSSQSGTLVLMAPPKAMAAVRQEQNAFTAKQAEVRALGKIGGNRQAAKKPASKAGGARGLLMIVGAIGVFAFLFLGDDGKKPTGPARPSSSAKKPEETPHLGKNPLPPVEAGPIARSAETFFTSGFREFNAHNFIRARTQFETVLQIAPGHSLAALYLENCNREIKAEVKFHLERGKRSREAGKLREARGHYEAVMRLLDKEKTSDDFKEAKTGLEQVNKEIRGEGGES
jgi:hypothetical protein